MHARVQRVPNVALAYPTRRRASSTVAKASSRRNRVLPRHRPQSAFREGIVALDRPLAIRHPPRVSRTTATHDMEQVARQRLDELTKPRGSLGRLEDIVVQLARSQQNQRPRSRPAVALICASDHVVVHHGVSAYPQAVTRAMVENIVRGGAAVSVLGRTLGVPVIVLDVGVLGDPTTPHADGRVTVVRPVAATSPGGDLREAEAVDEHTARAIEQAAHEVVAGIAADTAVLILGELGIGNTTAAAAVVSALLDLPASVSVGRGTGIDDDGLARKREVVAAAVRALGPDREPRSVLRRVGGRDLLAMASAAEAACRRGMVVLVDGYVAGAAVLGLLRSAPELSGSFIWAHRSAEPGHAHLLAAVQATPLLSLDMRLGEGSGALVALPLLDAACALYAQMSTFAEAAVPDRSGGA